MEPSTTARRTAAIIYLILAVMWCAITGILAYNLGSKELAALFQNGVNSVDFIVFTLAIYALLSLLLGLVLLSRLAFSAAGLKLLLGLALLPLIAAPFDATDMYGAIVYLIPAIFVYRFYKESGPVRPAPKRTGHLRRIK